MLLQEIGTADSLPVLQKIAADPASRSLHAPAKAAIDGIRKRDSKPAG